MSEITIIEIKAYATWQKSMDDFKVELQKAPEINELSMGLCDEHERERSNGVQQDIPGTRRFLAIKGQLTVGFMILRKDESSLKIVSIVADKKPENKKGVARALIIAAANESLRSGCGGSLTLYDASNGTGTSFYNFMGFRNVDSIKMRLDHPGIQRATPQGAHWAYQDKPMDNNPNSRRGTTRLAFVDSGRRG
jgi:hypothetical protein